MDLQQEYFNRKKLRGLIKYPDKSNLILKTKKNGDLCNLILEKKSEQNHPPYFYFTVQSHLSIYSNADFSQFSYHHSKTVFEQKWEWDNYEDGLLNWCKSHGKAYQAINNKDSILINWEMFVSCYDSWFANFSSMKSLNWLANSLIGDKEEKLKNVTLLEEWCKERHEKIYSCWKNVKLTSESKNYADWLAEIINAV